MATATGAMPVCLLPRLPLAVVDCARDGAAVIISIRASVRRRRASIVLVALAAALLFGGALGAFAGARRSSTAVNRLLAGHGPEDVFVAPPEDGTLDMDAVERLPQVRGAWYPSYLAMVPVGPDGRPQLDLIGSINPYLDTPAIDRPDASHRMRIVRGRDVDASNPLEVVIDEELAADRGLTVGSRLVMAAYAPSQMETVFGNEISGDETPLPEGPVLDLSVVGIARMPVDLHPGEESHTTSFGGTKDIHLSPALYERFGEQIIVFGEPVAGMPEAIRLERGLDDVDAFTAAVRALPGGAEAQVDLSDSDRARQRAHRRDGPSASKRPRSTRSPSSWRPAASHWWDTRWRGWPAARPMSSACFARSVCVRWSCWP